jgi:hypothetical protein
MAPNLMLLTLCSRFGSLSREAGRAALVAAVPLALASQPTQPDHADESAPFSRGERLTYQVSLANGSKVGTASMWIDGPVDVRGTSTLLLRFDSRIRYLLVPAVSSSSSWFDPARQAALRFVKEERNPLSHHDESIELYPEDRRWKSADGETGVSPSDRPLDELSFMYFIRTLPLTPGAIYHFDRHFDSSRNPSVVSIIRREVIPTPMGEIHVVRIEMRVRDPRHYEGEGIIRIHLSDDECRLPVRIESKLPVIGTAILTLASEQSRCQMH